MHADDMDLVREFAERNSEDAFATLVQRHVNLVYSVALRRLGNAGEAEEVTQAVFIILARKAAGLRPGTVLSGWLYQTAQLTAANYQRAAMRRLRREQEAFMQFSESSAPDDAWRRLGPLLEDAMAVLGQKERDAVVLRFFENRTVREIGSALGLGEAAAQKRVNRATDKLRKFFLKRGVQVSAVTLLAALGTSAVQAAPAGLAMKVTASAVVKGAAASASTLTLIQSTLKLMAWAKIKTAVMIGAAVIVAAGATTMMVNAVQPSPAGRNPEGAWEGILKRTNGTSIRAVLKVSRANGAYSARADVIETRANNFPVQFTFKDPEVRFGDKEHGFEFQGRLTGGATQWIGTWNEGGESGSVTFERTDDPDTVFGPLADADCAPRTDSELQGYWKGAELLGGKPFPLLLKISEPSKGKFIADYKNVWLHTKTHVAQVEYDPPKIKFMVREIGGTFEGTVDATRSELQGIWTFRQSKPEPMKFTRGNAAAERAQEAALDATKNFSPTGPEDSVGHWKAKSGNAEWLLDVARLPDGKFSVSVAMPNRDGAVPATMVQATGAGFRMECGYGSVCAFQGNVENGKLTGTWRYGRKSTPQTLVFERQTD